MVHAPPREGGAVPDGLYYGDGHPSVPERFRPSLAQLRPFYGNGVPPQLHPMGAHHLPGATLAVPPTTHETADSGRPVVHHPVAGDSKTSTQGVTAERVDFGWDVEDSG